MCFPGGLWECEGGNWLPLRAPVGRGKSTWLEKCCKVPLSLLIPCQVVFWRFSSPVLLFSIGSSTVSVMSDFSSWFIFYDVLLCQNPTSSALFWHFSSFWLFSFPMCYLTWDILCSFSHPLCLECHPTPTEPISPFFITFSFHYPCSFKDPREEKELLSALPFQPCHSRLVTSKECWVEVFLRCSSCLFFCPFGCRSCFLCFLAQHLCTLRAQKGVLKPQLKPRLSFVFQHWARPQLNAEKNASRNTTGFVLGGQSSCWWAASFQPPSPRAEQGIFSPAVAGVTNGDWEQEIPSTFF